MNPGPDGTRAGQSRRHCLLAAAAGALAWTAPARALQAPTGEAVLTVSGRLRRPNQDRQAVFDMSMLEALAQTSLVVHTPWYNGPRTFVGPLLRDVLDVCGAQGDVLRLTALNDFRADIPFSDVIKHEVIVARLMDGKPMSVREKGPLFVMYPFGSKAELRSTVYYSRAVWQLRWVEIL